MLIDANLLPTYQKALKDNPKAILKIADAYKFGEGVPQNQKIAHTWYEKLLNFKNLPFVEYEYCYSLAASAAYDRNDFKLAYKRLNKSINLFVKKYGVNTAMEKLNEFDFFDSYYKVKILNDADCD